MNRQKKISFIVPYFGKFPPMARYYFKFCTLNPDADFLIFTDQVINYSVSDNVKFIPFSLRNFNELVHHKLDLEVKVKFPYKLCDFKPLYGHIFEDYLNESSFWGYTDLDMIMGKISNFITGPILREYDIVTSRSSSFAGNFTIFRNSRTNKFLYTKSDNWKNILKQSNHVFSFPEQFKEQGRACSNSLSYRLSNLFNRGFIQKAERNDLNNIAKANNWLKVYYGDFILSDEYFVQRNINNWEVIFENGLFRELNSGKEGLYFHFYKLKQNISSNSNVFKTDIDPRELLITENGVYERSK